ncbi:ACT domain-containing protein [Candidatus Hydrogenedentota bacterium]
MRIKQISTTLENKPGALHKFATDMAEGGVNMRSLTCAEKGEAGDHGIARMVVDDFPKADELLTAKGYKFTEDPVLAVEVSDEPGGLDKILGILAKADINVNHLYAFIEKHERKAVTIIAVSSADIAKAVSVLGEEGIYG